MLPSGGKILKDKLDASYISVMTAFLRLHDGNSHKIVKWKDYRKNPVNYEKQQNPPLHATES